LEPTGDPSKRTDLFEQNDVLLSQSVVLFEQNVVKLE